MSVLVVDDQLLNRVTLAKVLETFNFPVVQAANGLEGVQQFLKHRASLHVVFMDLMMPELDGWTTALKIRCLEEENDWARTSIVGFTSENFSLGSPVWLRCMESGMDDVVAKPINRSCARQLLSRYVPSWATPPPPPPPSRSSSWLQLGSIATLEEAKPLPVCQCAPGSEKFMAAAVCVVCNKCALSWSGMQGLSPPHRLGVGLAAPVGKG